jgi:transcriptional regulator with XRE-family HTH domain
MKTLLGQRIRQFRKSAGLSQIELELRIDAAFGSISRMENGITNPTKETLFAIAQALSLNSFETAYLFGIEITQSN